MTDTIQDQKVQDVRDPARSTPAGPPSRSRLPLVLAVGGAAVVLAAAAIAFWPQSSGKAPVAAAGFASGSTVDVVLSCSGPDAPCSGGVTAPDGTQWFWSTTVDQKIPATWQFHQITGSLVTNGDWGSVTYISGDQTVTLFGGMATPEHSYFG
ncbi:MAG: hypothetical protein ACXWB2_00880 [Acidimicrobiales bacterium]